MNGTINQLEGGEYGNFLYNVFIYFKGGKISTLIIELISPRFPPYVRSHKSGGAHFAPRRFVSGGELEN